MTETPSVEGLQRQLIELKITIIEKEQIAQREEMERHHIRLRPLEDTAVRFNFLLYLTMGGGLIQIVNLLAIVFVIVKSFAP